MRYLPGNCECCTNLICRAFSISFLLPAHWDLHSFEYSNAFLANAVWRLVADGHSLQQCESGRERFIAALGNAFLANAVWCLIAGPFSLRRFVSAR